MATQQVSTGITAIESQRLGYQAISLSEMTTSAATVIEAGSKVEIASALFNVTSDETPNATSWTAITTANTAYLTLTPSGTAGSQIFSAAWEQDTPVWVGSKAGYYASAASTVRYVGGCYKAGATSYQKKFILDPAQRRLDITDGTTKDFAQIANLKLGTTVDQATSIQFANGVTFAYDLYGFTISKYLDLTNGVANTFDATTGVVKKKIYAMTPWNMWYSSGGAATFTLAHGLGGSFVNILTVQAIVIRDDSALKIVVSKESISIDATNITINAPAACDSANYDSVGGFVRGWVTVEYFA